MDLCLENTREFRNIFLPRTNIPAWGDGFPLRLDFGSVSAFRGLAGACVQTGRQPFSS